MTASPNLPSIASRMADSPMHRPSSVIRFGSIRLKLCPENRVRRGRRRRVWFMRAGRTEATGLSLAITVSPPIIRCPTEICGTTPSGKYRSVRLPKRMMPKRWPVSERLVLGDIAEDAPRDQPGDLHDHDILPGGELQVDRVALVLIRGLVIRGAEELAGMVGDLGDGPGNRRAVHMHVQHREEDRYAQARGRAQGQARRAARRARC